VKEEPHVYVNLKVTTSVDLNRIRSNGIPRCAYGGIPITPDNDSGWEAFVGDGTTQPVCAWCDAMNSGELYPCKPDIFEASYEEVEGEGNA